MIQIFFFQCTVSLIETLIIDQLDAALSALYHKSRFLALKATSDRLTLMLKCAETRLDVWLTVSYNSLIYFIIHPNCYNFVNN